MESIADGETKQFPLTAQGSGRRNDAVRRALATFLLLCIGMMIPLAASPVRVCLLDGSVMMSAFKAASDAQPENDCCTDCDDPAKSLHDDCCADLEKLPDSTLPLGKVDAPDMAVMDVVPLVLPPICETWVTHSVFIPSTPIRGPDSPCAYRAVLAIWRI